MEQIFTAEHVFGIAACIFAFLAGLALLFWGYPKITINKYCDKN